MMPDIDDTTLPCLLLSDALEMQQMQTNDNIYNYNDKLYTFSFQTLYPFAVLISNFLLSLQRYSKRNKRTIVYVCL